MLKFYEKTVKRKRIYKGHLLGLREDTVKLPNGGTARREIVEHPGAVAIVALTDDKKLLLIRQYRKPVEEALFEIPAGLVKKGERDREAARRELEEEAGFRAGKIKEVLRGYVSPGYSTELIRYFLATDLKKTRQNLEGDELIDVKPIGLKDALKLVWQGKIKDNKTLVGIMIAGRLIKA